MDVELTRDVFQNFVNYISYGASVNTLCLKTSTLTIYAINPMFSDGDTGTSSGGKNLSTSPGHKVSVTQDSPSPKFRSLHGSWIQMSSSNRILNCLTPEPERVSI